MRNCIKSAALVALGLTILLAAPAAWTKPPVGAKCVKKRLNLLAKAVKSQTNCYGRAALGDGTVDEDCLAKAKLKFAAGWVKNDEKSEPAAPLPDPKTMGRAAGQRGSGAASRFGRAQGLAVVTPRC